MADAEPSIASPEGRSSIREVAFSVRLGSDFDLNTNHIQSFSARPDVPEIDPKKLRRAYGSRDIPKLLRTLEDDDAGLRLQAANALFEVVRMQERAFLVVQQAGVDRLLSACVRDSELRVPCLACLACISLFAAGRQSILETADDRLLSMCEAEDPDVRHRALSVLLNLSVARTCQVELSQSSLCDMICELATKEDDPHCLAVILDCLFNLSSYMAAIESQIELVIPRYKSLLQVDDAGLLGRALRNLGKMAVAAQTQALLFNEGFLDLVLAILDHEQDAIKSKAIVLLTHMTNYQGAKMALGENSEMPKLFERLLLSNTDVMRMVILLITSVAECKGRKHALRPLVPLLEVIKSQPNVPLAQAAATAVYEILYTP